MSTQNLIGTWTLEANAPFVGKQTLTLKLDANGDALRGTVSHTMGSVELTDIEISDSNFAATAALDVQGKHYAARINGQTDGDAMQGTIKVDLPLIPSVKFTGHKEQGER
ncbi:MAG: hypothetical protein NVSMB56_20600 [Pyrinomonadaceae bacterium]